MVFTIVALIGTIISIVLGLTIGVNVLGFTDGYIIRSVANTLLLLVGINIIIASCSKLFLKKINPMSKRYQVHDWEDKFYVKLGIRKWKDKIPELGKLFAGFDKSQVGDMKDNEHVKQFIAETVLAEYIHVSSAILGLLAVFGCLKTWYIVGLPLLLANFIINIMPAMVQRYNRPKLMLLYKRNERNMQKQAQSQAEQAEQQSKGQV